MKLRTVLPVIVGGACAVANAQVTFSNISATYSLTPGSGTINWIVNGNGPAMTIDFMQNAPAFKVGDSTTFSTGTSRITFDVTSAVPIFGIDLLIQGNVQDFGRVQFSESASDGSGALGSVSSSVLGASWAGGVNGAFTNTYHIAFNRGVTSFSVVKGFDLDINGQGLPSSSVAGVSLVEQNMSPVPEPASLAALGFGAAALLRRRRR